MSEHYPSNTVSVEAFCKKCLKRTQHRIDDHRIGCGRVDEGNWWLGADLEVRMKKRG